MPNTSHFAFLQDPTLFNAALLHFLGDRESYWQVGRSCGAGKWSAVQAARRSKRHRLKGKPRERCEASKKEPRGLGGSSTGLSTGHHPSSVRGNAGQRSAAE